MSLFAVFRLIRTGLRRLFGRPAATTVPATTRGCVGGQHVGLVDGPAVAGYVRRLEPNRYLASRLQGIATLNVPKGRRPYGPKPIAGPNPRPVSRLKGRKQRPTQAPLLRRGRSTADVVVPFAGRGARTGHIDRLAA
jgi:hypothetical protein